jgi:hypothetical protein
MKKIISIVGKVLNWILLLGLTSFICVETYTQHTWQQEMVNGYNYNMRETARVLAVQDAQNYSAPIIRITENLSNENKTLHTTVEEAKKIVAGVHEENERLKKALHESVKMLSKQIVENNRCVDHIRRLERFIRILLKKIPVSDRPKLPVFMSPNNDKNIDNVDPFDIKTVRELPNHVK